MTVKLLATWGAQPAGTRFTSDAVTEAAMVAAGQATTDLTGSIEYVVNAGSPGGPANSFGSLSAFFTNLDVGVSRSVRPNYAGAITSARVDGFDSNGAAQVGSAVWRVQVNGTDIFGSSPPTLNNATTQVDTSLAGWSRSFLVGDLITLTLTAVTTIAAVLLSLSVSKS